ncbi:MAG: diadenylate cyclase CdaA [Thermosulfidibacteraceae bacterium]|jgi:uncharacterized protein (TIGR00159 family)
MPNILKALDELLIKRTVTWKDVLDILIVSTIVYQLIRIIRGTNAFRILLGIVVLILFSIAAKVLELKSLMWLFQNFWHVGVFAVIVIFQPELRRGLAEVGSIYRRASVKELLIIEAVSNACEFLARKRIGALIVFERNAGLKNYIESGIILDAVISEELLVTIFIPYSPLHDGAVIIRGDRVAAASCLLPLSIDPTISKQFGTRHRAALGISTETDAVAVVVSEETGIISVAVDGKLYRGLDKTSLEKQLLELVYEIKDWKRNPIVSFMSELKGRWRRLVEDRDNSEA